MNLFSLNFASIEIEEERVSSSQDKCTLRLEEGGMDWCSKTYKGTRANKGGGREWGQNSGILRECAF